MKTRINNNEFKTWMRWHDYVSIIIHEFPILLVRKYDWMKDESSTLIIQIFGFKVCNKIWDWK